MICNCRLSGRGSRWPCKADVGSGEGAPQPQFLCPFRPLLRHHRFRRESESETSESGRISRCHLVSILIRSVTYIISFSQRPQLNVAAPTAEEDNVFEESDDDDDIEDSLDGIGLDDEEVELIEEIDAVSTPQPSFASITSPSPGRTSPRSKKRPTCAIW